MAHESSNPKVRMMLIVAFIAAISLVLFDQIFRSYYNSMMEEEESEKVLTVVPKQLNDLRAAEQTRLTSAALPIDRAMKELATRGREDPALKTLGKADITPEPSNDNAALAGWGLLAVKPVEPPGHGDAPAPAPGDHGAAGDAGPTAAGDGGIALATDAGARAGDAAVRDAAAAPAPAPNPHGGH